ncbi:MAG: LTA synthase family protein, partial [Ruminiclostridium sp.]|nr:LTA synthase family protein [Ruminiclostridium sp.]
YSPQLSVRKLGLLTTMRLDLQRLVFGDGDLAAFGPVNDDIPSADPAATVKGIQSDVPPSGTDGTGGNNVQSGNSGTEGTESTESTEDADLPAGTEPAEPAKDPEYNYNTMKIDFDTLIANEKDPTILGMHKYFSSVEPTKKNAYTGLFKGNNLILLTAESFSPYAVDPELTPTLYKMVKEGFEFKNFYNPVWGVSTSDGEYVACTGLMPKAGIWSFVRSGQNYMPFAMGNQFKKLGYITKAWHDHTYTYYKRNISHPNMGYDYKGVGNGLEIKKTWPESDLEMIEVTAPEYVGAKPFHTYYMTVSGHLQYNFTGNFIANKNREFVDDLPLSTPAKAYIAANMELEFAIKALIKKLEAAGIAENTVIAISPDHYPYGLPRESIDELAGHKVEDNFELYKSTLIIWKKGMEPVSVDKPCSSLDIIPTLSNLFGLEYDSRLLMGRDILSDAPPLVIFSNWSWITDRARFNSVDNKVEFTDGTEKGTEYIKSINRIAADRYKYSVKILENDYYGRILPLQ